jgi:hypothetical protein
MALEAQRAQEMALEAQRAQEMALEAQRAQEMALEAQKVIEAHDLKFKAAFECLGKALNEIVDREEDSLRVKAQYLQVLKEPERTAQQTPKFERAFKALTTAIKAILSSDIVERIFARYSELTAPPPVVPDRKPEPSKPRPSSQGPSR